MVLAISFLEAPLKFRAPGVTLQIGLGIGRLVFRALNIAEVLLAVCIGIGITLSPSRSPVSIIAAYAFVLAVLAVQLLGVRPRLRRRSDTVSAEQDGPRSRAHYAYIGLEAIKVCLLAAVGILLLSS